MSTRQRIGIILIGFGLTDCSQLSGGTSPLPPTSELTVASTDGGSSRSDFLDSVGVSEDLSRKATQDTNIAESADTTPQMVEWSGDEVEEAGPKETADAPIPNCQDFCTQNLDPATACSKVDWENQGDDCICQLVALPNGHPCGPGSICQGGICIGQDATDN